MTTPIITPLAPYFGEEPYHRSQLFNENIGINPLIAAAMPLLLMAMHLSSNTAIDATLLFKQLCHEIKAFEQAAARQHYSREIILITRYLLCTVLDEWAPTESLLMFFHHETEGNQHFFVILERLSHNIEQHIDLLEFIYICLNIGFTGRQDPTTLLTLRNRLFDGIYHYHGDLKKSLTVGAMPTVAIDKSLKISTLSSIIAGTFMLCIIYGTFDYQFVKATVPINQQMTNIIVQS